MSRFSKMIWKYFVFMRCCKFDEICCDWLYNDIKKSSILKTITSAERQVCFYLTNYFFFGYLVTNERSMQISMARPMTTPTPPPPPNSPYTLLWVTVLHIRYILNTTCLCPINVQNKPYRITMKKRTEIFHGIKL